MLRRTILTAALIVATLSTAAPPATATGRGPCSEDRYEVTVTTPPAIREDRIRALVRCVFRAVGIGAQAPAAYPIIARESGYRPWATNPATSSACRPWGPNPYGSCGLFQHLARYWPGRARALPDRYFPNPRPPVLQARANVWATALLVRADGWCHWTPPAYCAG